VAHAVAFATIRTARHDNICGKFLHNAIANTAHTDTAIVLRVPSIIAGEEICFGQRFPTWGTCIPRGTFAYLKGYI